MDPHEADFETKSLYDEKEQIHIHTLEKQSLILRPNRRNQLANFLKVTPQATHIYYPPILSWYKDPNSSKFLLMMFLTASYCLVELGIGIHISSLALIADSLHMISDLISLIIGFYAVEMSKRQPSLTASYGYFRMEVVGGLINGTSLLAIGFMLVLDAIERFFITTETDVGNYGLMLIWVAAVGLGVNILGVIIFSRGGHGHSHGGHGHSHRSPHSTHKSEKKTKSHPSVTESKIVNLEEIEKTEEIEKQENLNIQAILLHLLGDALGSIAVILSGLVIYYSHSPNRVLADPICTLVITILILFSTIPLIRRTVHILLQQAPAHIQIEKIQKAVLSLPGVHEIHDFHIWQISQQKVVGSMHALIYEDINFNEISDQIKAIFHANGIHSSTIQPEYVPRQGPIEGETDLCNEILCENKTCHKNLCCPPTIVKHRGGQKGQTQGEQGEQQTQQTQTTTTKG